MQVVLGTVFCAIEDTHNGAHVIPGLLPDAVISNVCMFGKPQALYGILPKQNIKHAYKYLQ